jgi:SAM-dependent methyltransferase
MISSIKLLVDKVRDDYDAIAGSFSDTRTRPWPEMSRLRELLVDGDRVLDVGCGNGRAYALLRGETFDYVGVDNSAELVRLARERYPDLLAEWRVGSILELPFEGGDFDVVAAFAVLHHIPSRAFRLKALAEAYRVLRPGGQFMMTNWNLGQTRFWRLRLQAFLRRLAGSGYDAGDVLVPWRRGPRSVDRYCHAFTRRELAGLCREVGFEVTENGYSKPGWLGFLKSGNLVTICRRPEAELEPVSASGLE